MLSALLAQPVVLLGIAAAVVIYFLLAPKKTPNPPQLVAAGPGQAVPHPGWPGYLTNRDAEMMEDAQLISEHFQNSAKAERVANALAKHGVYLNAQAPPAGKSSK